LGGAAAAEGQCAVNALDVDKSSCGFDRARSRPAKMIKGAKKTATSPSTSVAFGVVKGIRLLAVMVLQGERPREIAETRHTSLQPSRHVYRKGAAPLSGAEELTARTINAYAQCACLLSLQMGSINFNKLD